MATTSDCPESGELLEGETGILYAHGTCGQEGSWKGCNTKMVGGNIQYARKISYLYISVITVSIFKTYTFPTLEFDHDHLLGTWIVMVNDEEDGTVTCTTTSATEKTCDFSKHGIRKMKSSHLSSKRRSNMQSRSAGLTLDPQGKRKLQWGSGHHWIEGKS